jgi:hypothetical protein
MTRVKKPVTGPSLNFDRRHVKDAACRIDPGNCTAPPTRILHDAEQALSENGTAALAVKVCSLVNDR